MAEMKSRMRQNGDFDTLVSAADPIPVSGTLDPSTAYGLSPVAYDGTTEAGSAAVGTLSFAGACHAFTFFNKSSSTNVQISFDGATWMGMNANSSWEVIPPGGPYYNAGPLTELYHRQTTTTSTQFYVLSWEV